MSSKRGKSVGCMKHKGAITMKSQEETVHIKIIKMEIKNFSEG